MKKLYQIITAGLLSMAIMVSGTFAQQSFLKQNLTNAPELPGLNKGTYDVQTQAQTAVDNVLKTISDIVNWVLGLLALIAIIILVYTGVKMLLNSGDDKATSEGYKTVKNIFIALLFIGASWLIVQFIFYIIKLFVGA